MSFHLRANSTCPHIRQMCYTILVSAQEEASKTGEDSGKGNKNNHHSRKAFIIWLDYSSEAFLGREFKRNLEKKEYPHFIQNSEVSVFPDIW